MHLFHAYEDPRACTWKQGNRNMIMRWEGEFCLRYSLYLSKNNGSSLTSILYPRSTGAVFFVQYLYHGLYITRCFMELMYRASFFQTRSSTYTLFYPVYSTDISASIDSYRMQQPYAYLLDLALYNREPLKRLVVG
ncbi:hypothetical protein BCR41DRAFT_63124 [Lobosporangium transversale]|uniref:Uncharacterized protein n=1 Tax=Lobosporangium transversale TaxID=64571 RepID=A0A1Y2GMC6_9FUNG|nr:hypothetical protein BCR41DRAFT_63124 [Lobosporangium transversale]ORZ15437.1 hypothetical protein BCR41DRAFT_63124 [Lobosporangium transversale]|eukprot:XP_021881185.1 hypothetical protein BCR41DRAFT_63124 [Lobosporangium transversale]